MLTKQENMNLKDRIKEIRVEPLPMDELSELENAVQKMAVEMECKISFSHNEKKFICDSKGSVTQINPPPMTPYSQAISTNYETFNKVYEVLLRPAIERYKAAFDQISHTTNAAHHKVWNEDIMPKGLAAKDAVKLYEDLVQLVMHYEDSIKEALSGGKTYEEVVSLLNKLTLKNEQI